MADGGPTKKAKLASSSIAELEARLEVEIRDVDAWQGLIKELKSKRKSKELVGVYERMVKVFPRSGQVWTEYIELVMANEGDDRIDSLFEASLIKVPYVPLWELYLRYVKRVNAEKQDANTIATQAYEFALSHIQSDIQSGPIWQEFIQFLEQLPAANQWEQQHKMDEIRRVYRKAVALPLSNIEALWRAYNSFENSISRTTARKFIDERSAGYMHARSVARELNGLEKGVDKTTLPHLRQFVPEDADVLKSWRKVLAYEKSNPLQVDADAMKNRVLYTYRQALVSMRYYPELWLEFSDYCLETNEGSEAEEVLDQGLIANPTSFFLTTKLASIHETAGSME